MCDTCAGTHEHKPHVEVRGQAVLMSAPGCKLGLWLLWQARWPGFEEIGNRVSGLPTPGHLVTPHLDLADSPIHFAGFVPATVLSESRPVLLLPLMATEN